MEKIKELPARRGGVNKYQLKFHSYSVTASPAIFRNPLLTQTLVYSLFAY